MKIEDQVCSWRQGKRLKELGVKMNSLFFHVLTSEYRVCMSGFFNEDLLYRPAFTVAELGIMLPNHYPSWRFPVPGQDKEMWIATVICQPKPPGIDDIHTAHEFDRMGDTQAQALATLLISLLETETITAEEVNDRLKKEEPKP